MSQLAPHCLCRTIPANETAFSCRVFFIPLHLCAQTDSAFIDPTGTYRKGPAIVPGDEPYPAHGVLHINYIGEKKIVVELSVCSAPPANNVGYFCDTLIYDDNWAEWRTDLDATCVIRFAFSGKGVNVRQISSVPGWACGFGHNVYADGYYRKTSSGVPVIDCEEP